MTYRRRKMTHRAAAAVATATIALGSVAACSSSGGGSGDSTRAGSAGSGSTGSASAQDCIAKAEAFLKKYPELPTSLGPALPALSANPPAGKVVIKLVNGKIPSDNDSAAFQAAAATTIGWTGKKIPHDGSVEDVNAKLDQAISEKPAMIALSGWPVEAISRPLAAAKAAGIVVVLSSVPDSPTSYPGFSAVINGPTTTALRGTINANMFMRASKCTGHVAIFSLPFPVLKIATNAFRDAVKQNCSKCKIDYNEITADRIGTPAATSSIVSKLQSDSSIKWVFSIIANLATGLDSAVNQAGIKGISVFGNTPDENSIKALREKTNSWWVGLSPELTAWSELAFGLQAYTTHQPVSDAGNFPQTILTQDNVPDGTSVPSYPTDFKAEYAKLWGTT